MRSAATQVQMLGSAIAFKVQNWPPCVLEVYLWPIAVREKTNIGLGSRRNKREEFKDVTGRLTERNVSRRKSGNARMEMLDLRQSLARLVSTRWLPAQLIFSRYAQQTQENVYFTTAYEMKHLCKRGWGGQ